MITDRPVSQAFVTPLAHWTVFSEEAWHDQQKDLQQALRQLQMTLGRIRHGVPGMAAHRHQAGSSRLRQPKLQSEMCFSMAERFLQGVAQDRKDMLLSGRKHSLQRCHQQMDMGPP